MNKNTFIIGFMLFAIFFGAGNLIFPPTLGLNSGPEFWSTLFGFVITGVGLPLLGIVVSAFYHNGYKTALTRIHPWFAVIFLMAIYLTIGPFFAIPRTGATSYEMAVLPFIGEAGRTSLLAFTVVYYAVTLWLSLNPSKMVERIGAILTPALLIAILALIGKSVWWLYGNPPTMPAANFGDQSAFLAGFIGGYQTMDVLASVAFSVIVINAIKAKMPADQRDNQVVMKQTFVAGIIAAVSLAIIYVGLAWVSNRLPVSPDTLADLSAKQQDIGSFLLNTAAYQTFGSFGRILFGIIVLLWPVPAHPLQQLRHRRNPRELHPGQPRLERRYRQIGARIDGALPDCHDHPAAADYRQLHPPDAPACPPPRHRPGYCGFHPLRGRCGLYRATAVESLFAGVAALRPGRDCARQHHRQNGRRQTG